MKKDVYWFTHDSNAHRDQKILEMISVYGMEGYGWWWTLLELMRETTDFKLKIKGKYAIPTLANELRTTPERLTAFINDCVGEFELFESDGQYFCSPSFNKRMQNYKDVIDKRRDAANKRWNNT
jgi:hypothetical protein